MNLLQAKDRLLELADIRRHMEYAGFRKATHGNRWYCGFHEDHTPSVTVRDNKAHCWSGCNQLYDVLEVETIATGESFTQVVRRLARDYGLDLDREKPQTPEQKLAIQLVWRRDTIAAELWKLGMLASLREQLADAQRILFPFHGVNSEAAHIVRYATSRIAVLRHYNLHRSVEAYREHRLTSPKEAAAMVKLGHADDAHARTITALCCGYLQAACSTGQSPTGTAGEAHV